MPHSSTVQYPSSVKDAVECPEVKILRRLGELYVDWYAVFSFIFLWSLVWDEVEGGVACLWVQKQPLSSLSYLLRESREKDALSSAWRWSRICPEHAWDLHFPSCVPLDGTKVVRDLASDLLACLLEATRSLRSSECKLMLHAALGGFRRVRVCRIALKLSSALVWPSGWIWRRP